jgi:Cu/Ag efflux pump CusA
VAEVRVGPRSKRGEASISGQHAVVLTIQKQPGASTIELTRKIDVLLQDLQKTLPKGARIESDLFKQSRFIESSIANVEEALRDGAIMVAIVLFLFLLNLRTTAITLVTIPLSLLVTAIVFKFMGLGINTMTLGGLAIAIGELVDDAIVDVENVFRRLKENRSSSNPRSSLQVIFEASSEVRNSIVFSTIIVALVFIPLFALGGIEGRLFAPLGVAYILALLASLLISLTVTPVLCSYLLSRSKGLSHREDGALVRHLKKVAEKILRRTIHHPALILTGCGVMLLGALALLPLMGRSFLPAFNEGTATIGVAAAPGISLAASDALGTRVEQAMLSIPEIKSTIRRTGRAEMDEHAEGVHWSEIDEMALNGVKVASFLERQRIYDIFMRLDEQSRADPEAIKSTLVKTLPNGQLVRVSDIAEVYPGTGPNMVNREDMQRRIVISANSSGRDLGSLIESIRTTIKEKVRLPTGYFITYGGQFESQQQASKLLILLGSLSLLGIIGVLYLHLVRNEGDSFSEEMVIVGGLFSSTLLDIIVTPAVFYRFGRRSVEKQAASHVQPNNNLSQGEFS